MVIEKNWVNWLRDMHWIGYGCERVKMVLDNLEDELEHLIRVEV